MANPADQEQTIVDAGILRGSSGSSSLDREIASAGFSRAETDELGDGSPPGAGLVQGEWSYSPTKLGPSDFELLRVVGQGAFGKVSVLTVLLERPESHKSCQQYGKQESRMKHRLMKLCWRHTHIFGMMMRFQLWWRASLLSSYHL